MMYRHHFYYTLQCKKMHLGNTVKPNDHPWEQKIVPLVDMWQLLTCGRYLELPVSSKWDLKMVAVVDRWTLFRGGC